MINWGRAFERYVAELYHEHKKAVVKMNELEFRKHLNGRVRSEFDIKYKNRLIPYLPLGEKIPTFGGWHYVECKFHKDYKNKRIGFDKIAKFSSSLLLMDNPQKKGEMITNTWYIPKVESFAEKVGIKLIDRDDLVLMDYLRTTMKQQHPPLMPYSIFDRKLEERIKSYA